MNKKTIQDLRVKHWGKKIGDRYPRQTGQVMSKLYKSSRSVEEIQNYYRG